MRKKTLFFLLATFSLGIYLPAQNPYIHHYTTFDGLPSNTVYFICQDSKKFLWFATDAGVVRYDGTTFTNFRKKDGLSSNEVIRIKEDSSGRIWFFNLNGKLNYFFKNRVYNSANAPFLDSIKNVNFFIDFFEDKDHSLYFYNRRYEIFNLTTQNKVEKINIDENLLKGKSAYGFPGESDLRFMNRNREGDFTFWTRCRITKVDASLSTPVNVFDSLSIWRVFPGPANSFYISAYTDGIFRFDNEDMLHSVSPPFQFPSAYAGITSILETSEGFLWIVTYDKGVYCMHDNQVICHLEIKDGQSVIQDNESNVWISSMKEGVYKISPYLNHHRHYENSQFQGRGVTALYTKAGKGLWFTNGKLIYLLKNRIFYTLDYQVDNIPYTRLYLLNNNTLIAGGEGTLFIAFQGIMKNDATRRIGYKNLVKTIQVMKNFIINGREDKLITFGHLSVFRYNSIVPFREPIEINTGEHVNNAFYNLKDDLVINARKIYLYRDGKLLPNMELSCFDNSIITKHLSLEDSVELFNIEGDSIYLYNQNAFFNLTAALGSPFDIQIRSIFYHKTFLYLSTFRNIYKCDHPINIINRKKVQLQLMDINFRNIHDIAVYDDSLCIASDDGLTIIPEAMINKITTHTPIPYFQSVTVNDKEQDPEGRELRMTGKNKITFSFSCINYSSSPILYSYRMEGTDTSWTTGTSRKIIYQSLKPGDYVFQLRVRKLSAAWSNPVECRITVKAAFWQHPLFYVSLILVFSLSVIFFIIRRKNLQMKRREIDHQLIMLEQKSLQSMMNPHFIFNSLGSIQNYLLQKKSGDAALYLSQFARLIRQNLNAINSANINLEEEVDRLKNYLDLEMLRMENKFRYVLDIDESLEADEILIPSMIIQPFVENAIWHGISMLSEQGEISIRFEKMDGRSLKIIICDNGIGMQKSASFSQKSDKHFHLGMEMTRRRLELLGKKYSVDTSIEISEGSPGLPNPGTKVVLVVPVSNGEVER